MAVAKDLFNLVNKKRLKTFSRHSDAKEFWGDYEMINNPIAGAAAGESGLLQAQLARLKLYEANSNGIKAANEFLGQMYQQDKDLIQGETKNEIYKSILAIINSVFSSNPNNIKQLLWDEELKKITGYKEGADKDTSKQKYKEFADKLEDLLDCIKYPEDRRAEIIDRFTGTAKKKVKGSTDSYTQWKAKEAEQLTRDALGPFAEVVGQITNRGKQLIEDVLQFSEESYNQTLNNGDIKLYYTIKEDGKTKGTKQANGTVADFFKDIKDALRKGNVTIDISDELYEKLTELATLRAQAKSSFKLQLLLNRSGNDGRNSISLNALGSSPEALVKLYELYEKNWLDTEAESQSLALMANYCLSKGIAKTNLTRNDIYFTKDGFQTAYGWMKTANQMLKFSPPVKQMANRFFDISHSYTFGSPQN